MYQQYDTECTDFGVTVVSKYTKEGAGYLRRYAISQFLTLTT